MIVMAGIMIFVIFAAIAVFTSNLFVSDKEKKADYEYIRRVADRVEVDQELRYSHANICIAKICRTGMLVGVFVIAIGMIFRG